MKTKNSLIEMFKLLYEKKCKIEEVTSALDISEATFHKNIAKFKTAGFKISYKDTFYRIDVFKENFSLTEEDKQTLSHLLKISDKLSKRKQKDFFSFVKKILLLTNEKDYNDVIKKYEFLKKAALFDEFEEKIKIIKANFKKRMCLILNSKEEIFATLLKLDFVKDKIYLTYENAKTLKEEKIQIDKIAKITSNKGLLLEAENRETIFELNSRLAKTYLLKEDERIIEKSANKLIIASASKDKDMFFKRLLRYDTLCKVLHPKQDVEKYKSMIDKSLENIQNQ